MLGIISFGQTMDRKNHTDVDTNSDWIRNLYINTSHKIIHRKNHIRPRKVLLSFWYLLNKFAVFLDMIRIHYNSFCSSFAYFENIFIISMLYAGIVVMIRINVLYSGDNYIFCIENESVQTTACSFSVFLLLIFQHCVWDRVQNSMEFFFYFLCKFYFANSLILFSCTRTIHGILYEKKTQSDWKTTHE